MVIGDGKFEKKTEMSNAGREYPGEVKTRDIETRDMMMAIRVAGNSCPAAVTSRGIS